MGQAYAAQELYSRDWRFHSVLKLWLKRVTPADGNVPPGVQFIYFDNKEWDRQFFAGSAQMIVSWMLVVVAVVDEMLAYLDSRLRLRFGARAVVLARCVHAWTREVSLSTRGRLPVWPRQSKKTPLVLYCCYCRCCFYCYNTCLLYTSPSPRD